MPRQEHFNALSPGARLRDYDIESVLGVGSFGITYKAREAITERVVAIKEYLPRALAARERDGITVRPVSEGAREDFEWGLKRFRREAKLLIGLRHPNIVPVLSYFETGGTGYLVMEFQSGRSLGERLATGATPSEAELLVLLPPLLAGIEAVHAQGFLHRDIKPDNIYIRTDGAPVLLDFGAARQAIGQRSLGLTAVLTEGYAPYEQYQREGNQGPWTDIYAIGAVTYRCLLGRVPAVAPHRLSASLHRAPDPLAAGFAELRARVSPRLAAATEAALAVLEQDRPQSVAELRRLLVEAPEAQATPPAETTIVPSAALSRLRAAPPPAPPPPLSAPRRRAAVLAVGMASFALAATAAGYFALAPDSPPAGPSSLAPASGPRTPDAGEEARRRADDEARRKAEDDARRKAEDDARRKAEDDARRKAEDDARRKAEDDARRKAEDDARRKAEDDARRKAEDDARRKAEDEARRKAEDDDRRKADTAQRAEKLVARCRAASEQARIAMVGARHADARRFQQQAEAACRDAERLDRAAAGLDAARRELAALDMELDKRTADRVRALIADARQHMQTGRFDDAQRALQEAQRLDPASAEAAAAGRELAAARRSRPPASGVPPSRGDVPAHVRQVYDQIMQWALRQPTRSLQGVPGTGTYRSMPSPKALAVCIDWSSSSPAGGYRFGGLGIMQQGTTNNVTRAQAIDTCASVRPNASCTCTVVDFNDTNVLVFPETYIAKHFR